MNRRAYQILLYFLRSLIYIKRALFLVLKSLVFLLLKISVFIKNKFGLVFYKPFFRLKKYFIKFKFSKDKSLLENFGKRNILQLTLFFIVVLIMYPHSQLYSKENNKIAGQETLLYKMIGPGQQDFSIEEINANYNQNLSANEKTWDEGAISAKTSLLTDNVNNNLTHTIKLSNTTAGGSAISKPIIIPGAKVETTPSDFSQSERKDVLYYTVQTGDSIGLIAQKYNISVATILWANNLSTNSYIRPGDELKILPVSGIVHVVKSGDTISRIAQLYDSDQEKIIDFNNIKANNINIGQSLVIPGCTKIAVAPSYTTTQRKYTQLSDVSAPLPSVSAPAGSGYLWPTSAKIITQYYGWRHTGLDIAGPVGTPLYASKSGTVITSQCGWNGGYGCYIILDHGGGVQTLYGHSSKLYVSVGDKVVQGQTIAAMGSTGRSTGPHIHFEVRINGARLNPLKYIR